MSTDNNKPTDPGGDQLRAVAGLAREVEALRNSVERLELLPGNVKTLGETVEVLKPLPAQVKSLARAVKSLASQINAAADNAGVPSWLDLPEGVGEAQELLTELADWLRVVFLRYPDAVTALPQCWWWHPDIVEELLWLMGAWCAAYRDEDATVARAGDWHDRYRPGVVKRIKASAGTCSLENHQSGGSHDRAAATAPLGEALAPIAAWWGSDRAAAAPAPDSQLLATAQAASTTRRSTGGARR